MGALYRVGRLPTMTAGTETHGGDYFRYNDGSLVIMLDEQDDEYSRPVLTVPRIIHVKRNEAWKAPDPEQEAFAERVASLLNGSSTLLDTTIKGAV